jgi:hypothetical protein
MRSSGRDGRAWDFWLPDGLLKLTRTGEIGDGHGKVITMNNYSVVYLGGMDMRMRRDLLCRQAVRGSMGFS